jgi:hypothetical protein
MRSLQSLNLATCTSELRAKRMVKRFRAFPELPLNIIGSGVLRTEYLRQISLRPRKVVSTGSRWDIGKTQDARAIGYDVRQLKRTKVDTLPKNFRVARAQRPQSIINAVQFHNLRNSYSSKLNQLR